MFIWRTLFSFAVKVVGVFSLFILLFMNLEGFDDHDIRLDHESDSKWYIHRFSLYVVSIEYVSAK